MKNATRIVTTIATIVIIILIQACESHSFGTFSEPQPSETSSLSQIPKSLQGKYSYAQGDSLANAIITIIVSDSSINFLEDAELKMLRNQIDSNSLIVGDTLIDLTSKEKIPIRIVGDTIIMPLNITNNNYYLDQSHVLKEMDGDFFLSIKAANKGWDVQKIHLKKGKLTISTIKGYPDYEMLKEITKDSKDTIPSYKIHYEKKHEEISPRSLPQETIDTIALDKTHDKGIPYMFKLSKKQFKKFVHSKGFTEDETYIRQ